MEALKVFRSRSCRTPETAKNYLCFRHALTNQYWLIRFDHKGMIDSACHVDNYTEPEMLHFTREFNELLEVEAGHLEFSPERFG